MPPSTPTGRSRWRRSTSTPTWRRTSCRLTTLRNFPAPFRLMAPFLVFVTTGFLPPLFREAMGLSWTARQQRRFDRLLRAVGRLERVLPRPLRMFPFNLWLADMRLRRRLGRPLV
ncbi:oxygenase MpaB family protein [Nocardioides convexus]|uniref:oxygenase MpaB family protein n=1 Tax=Nocardioides convexus TaxID=2712224 RepID=UPI003101A4AC